MGILNKLRIYFRNNSLKQHLQQKKAAIRQWMNFDKAASIGVLFDATDLDKRQTALKYAENLRASGKKVKLLGFFDSPQEDPNFTFGYFNRKNIDWALRPNGKNVEYFLQSTYDILITLNPLTHLHTEYIAALANAHLKVGPVTGNVYCYDMMIDVNNKNNIGDFIREMEKLFKITNI